MHGQFTCIGRERSTGTLRPHYGANQSAVSEVQRFTSEAHSCSELNHRYGCTPRMEISVPCWTYYVRYASAKVILSGLCVHNYDSFVNSLCLVTLVRLGEPLYKLLGGIQTIHDPEQTSFCLGFTLVSKYAK